MNLQQFQITHENKTQGNLQIILIKYPIFMIKKKMVKIGKKSL